MKLFTTLTFLTQTVLSIAAPLSIAATKDCSNAKEWDAIVVGAGLSGSIIAAKLATNAPDKCILVVEGGKHSGQIVDAENASIVTSHNRIFEDGYKTVYESPETFFNTPGIYDVFVCYDQDCDYVWGEDGSETPVGLVAGKLVGGSGALNGALMQYPPDSLWDAYPEGWKSEDMKKYLDEIHATMGATSYPSTDGKHYNDERGPDKVKAAMKAIGFVEGEDAAYWKPTGGTMGIPRVTTEGGRRASSTSVYLKPVLESNSNIQLWIDTDVREIELSDRNNKATGLKVKREGVEEDIVISQNGLIVVSGGGVKTPQLLLQSGIGPDADAKVVNDAVGKSLSDKPMTWLAFDVPGVEGYNLTNPPEADQKLFAEEGAGPLTQFAPLLVGFVEVPSENTDPNVYPTDKFKSKNLVEFFVKTAQEDGKVMVYFVHFTPHQSANSARIHSNMTVTGEQWDFDYSTKSTDYAMDVIKKAMAGQNYGPSSTGSEPWFHNMNHPGGTCELGECVDSDTLIVKGLENVGVCDNSIVPEQATVHTAHTLMGIALHCSDILTGFLMADIKDEPTPLKKRSKKTSKKKKISKLKK